MVALFKASIGIKETNSTFGTTHHKQTEQL